MLKFQDFIFKSLNIWSFFYFFISKATSWYIKSFLKCKKGFRVSVSRNIRKAFFREDIIYFFDDFFPRGIINLLEVIVFNILCLKSDFLIYKNFFRVTVSWKITNFLTLELENLISRKYNNFSWKRLFSYFLS